MPSVDDALRHAFATPDDDWTRAAPAARTAVVARHRRHRVVRRSVVGALAVAALVVGVTAVDSDTRPRTVQPALPSPTTASADPRGVSPLEGTWISGPLGAADVRAAARGAGAPDAAGRMLDDLPDGPFRVVIVVRGSSLRALVRSSRNADTLLDEEVVSTTGRDLELRTLFGAPASTVHRWAVRGDRLELSFGSTTEGSQDGIPGEAWHRLLYDSATFTR